MTIVNENIELIENAESKILILQERNKDLGCDLGQLKFDFEEITVKNETLKNINIDLEDKLEEIGKIQNLLLKLLNYRRMRVKIINMWF